MKEECTWEQYSVSDYSKLLKFFRYKPNYLVGCGIYCEDVHRLKFIYKKEGKLIEKSVPWSKVRVPTKKFLNDQMENN